MQATTVTKISRNQWKAKPAIEERLEPIRITSNHVIFTNTDTPPCTTKQKCIKQVQQLQEQHMKEGHPDIKYNFLIGGDGNVYEGRGWDWFGTRYPGFEDTLEIAYIDTIKDTDEKATPEDQLADRIATSLIEEGVSKQCINENYNIVDKLGVHISKTGRLLDAAVYVSRKILVTMSAYILAMHYFDLFYKGGWRHLKIAKWFQ